MSGLSIPGLYEESWRLRALAIRTALERTAEEVEAISWLPEPSYRIERWRKYVPG